jgi:hypothetical protein
MGHETLDVSLDKASQLGWPRRRCHSGDDAWATKERAGGRWSGYSGLELLHLMIFLREARTFTEQPVGSQQSNYY